MVKVEFRNHGLGIGLTDIKLYNLCTMKLIYIVM